jgi:broad specificity phosphatase PhoE
MARPERKLVLVRHSLPGFVVGVPASKWQLSDEGRRRCQRLADRLAAYDLAAVVTSTEPKAVETGQIVADSLSLPLETALGLHEHERGMVTSTGDQDAFQEQARRLFERPDELIFGAETADQAHARFATAVAAVIEQHPHGNLAIVTHGTVMTLFIARSAGLDPVPFWKSLGLPAFAVLSLPGLHLMEVIDNV